MSRVLVPVDFSEGSDRALKWAAELVRVAGGTLDVLHVVLPLHQLDPFFRAGSLPARTLARIRERAAARIAALLRPEAVRYTFRLVEGEPAACILDQIDRRKPALVVMGTHGRRGVTRLLLGSVTQKVARAATVPVVTVPPPRPAQRVSA